MVVCNRVCVRGSHAALAAAIAEIKEHLSEVLKEQAGMSLIESFKYGSIGV